VLVGNTVYDAAKVTAVPVYASVLGMLEDWSLRTITTAELNAKKQNEEHRRDKGPLDVTSLLGRRAQSYLPETERTTAYGLLLPPLPPLIQRG
jgi:hypothetical protein